MKIIMRYSVIIPAYQAENTIKICLTSLLKNTRLDFEVIVVNDGSTDETGKIISEMSDNRLKLITLTKNNGVSQARNYGIEIANGEYLTFVDSDDYVPEDYFEILDNAVKDNVDIAIFNYNIVKNQNEVCLKETNYRKNILLEPKEVYATMCIECSEGPWNKIYKKKIIIDNKVDFQPNIKMWEDMLFFAKVARFSKIIKAYEEDIYYCKYSYSGLTSQTPNKYVNDFIIMNETMINYLKIFNVSLSQLVDYSVHWLYLNLINRIFTSNSIETLSKANIIHRVLREKPTNIKVKIKQYLIRIYFAMC